MTTKKQTPTTEREAEKSSGASKPISFHPVPFEDALDALLATPPPSKDEPKKPTKKRVSAKR
jgi:hypothetical protein